MNDDETQEASPFEDMFGLLRKTRDELKLKMHLAKAEARDEFERLEGKWKEVEGQAEPLSGALRSAAAAGAEDAKQVAGVMKNVAENSAEQAKQVAGAAFEVAAQELESGYKKLRKILDS